MVIRFLVILLVVWCPTVILADNIWRSTNDGDDPNDTEQYTGSGTWEDPYEVPPTTAYGERPAGYRHPGHCIETSTLLIWNCQSTYWLWDGDDWDEINDPHIMVTVDGGLLGGEFVSTDRDLRVYAEIEFTDEEGNESEIDRLVWNGRGTPSGSGYLSFENISLSPTIAFVPHFAFSGRNYALSYEVKGTIGSSSHSVTITQGNVAQLRQEYIDTGKRHRPAQGDFTAAAPTYSGLLNSDDIHWYHTHWIADPIDDKAVETDGHYTGNLAVRYGYACPMENGHGVESQHLYGKALDFDIGENDNQEHSEQNYLMHKAGLDAGATFYLLSRLIHESSDDAF